MKRIRTEPRNHGAEGDERIRTAVPAPDTLYVYAHRTTAADRWLIEQAKRCHIVAGIPLRLLKRGAAS